MKSTCHSAAILCLATLFACHPTLAAQPAAQLKPITELTDGTSILAHASTLEDLLAKTKPTLHFDQPYHGIILLWTGTTPTHQHFFQIASARQYRPQNGPLQWIIAKADHPTLGSNDDILPKNTIPVGQGKRPKQYIGTENWARVVTTNPSRGTLYEIEYYFQTPAEAAPSTRLLVLQDVQNQWHYVTHDAGEFWDDTGWTETTRVSATWTDNPAAPLSLTIAWTGTAYDHETAPSPANPQLVWGQDDFYAGPLPFAKPASTTRYIQVQTGQTFNAIVKQILHDNAQGELLSSDRASPKSIQSMHTAILALNLKLQPDHLAIGEKIVIPSLEARKALINEPNRARGK